MPQILLEILPAGVFTPEQVLVLRTAYEKACAVLGCSRPAGDERFRKEVVARAILQAATRVDFVVEALVAEAIRTTEQEAAKGDGTFRGWLRSERGASSSESP